MVHPTITRRHLLGWAGGLAALTALSACGPNAGQPVPGQKAAEPTKPAAAATAPAAGATTAPAPAATTAPAGAKPAQPAGVKVTAYNGIGGANQKVYETWAKEFSDQNAGIQAELVTVVGGQAMTDKVTTLIAGGTPPDVFILYQEIVPVNAAVERTLVYAIDTYIKQDNYDIDAFLPQAVELNRWEGKLWAIPRDYGNQNVYYNIDLFKKANVPVPPTDWTDTTWTFEKYLETGKKLTVVEGGKTVQWGILVNRGWRPWASFVYSNGATVVKKNDKGVATEIALTDPAAIEALQFLQDLIYKDKVAPTPDAEADMGMQNFFGTGKIAMVIDNPTSAAAYRRFQNIDWDVAPLPVGKGGKRGTGGGGIAWAMTGATKNPDQAWKLLKYFTSEKAQMDEVAVGGTTPSRTKVANSDAFMKPERPKNARGFVQAQGFVVRDPVHIKWPQGFREVVSPNMDLLWNNKANAQTVATEIKTKLDALFKS
ncbi:MAG: extracellular solute-binding protein [Chloroflexi bacterium]|nr:extracellular solute-binding protein [Chloroflexota bacterium]